jgi:hypothetical protein
MSRTQLEIAYTYANNELLIDCLENANDKYIEIEYKSGKGYFKIKLYNLICKFSLIDYKKVVSMLIDDLNGKEKAEKLHSIFVAMVDDLNHTKKVYSYDKKVLSGVSDAFTRLNKLNDILIDNFNVSRLDIETQIKLEKAIAYKMIKRDQLAIDYNAKAFNKFGLTWIVSADAKIKGLKHIIVPCCGLPCASFNGSFKEAIEIVDLELKTRVEKILENKTFPDFINLLKVNGIDKVPA